MSKKTQKAIAIFLLITMCMGLAVTPAFAKEVINGNDWYGDELAVDVTAGTDGYTYMSLFRPLAHGYEFGGHFMGDGEGPQTFVVLDTVKYDGTTWTPSGLYKYGSSNYDVVYCCDVETMIVDGTYYKRLNLEDSEYYNEKQAAKIRAVVTNSYPYVSLDTMKKDLAAAGFQNADKLTRNEIIAAVQCAIWACANNMDAESLRYAKSYKVSDNLQWGYPLHDTSNESGLAVAGKRVFETYPEVGTRINGLVDYLLAQNATCADKREIVISNLTITEAVPVMAQDDIYKVAMQVELNNSGSNPDKDDIHLEIAVVDENGNVIKEEKEKVVCGTEKYNFVIEFAAEAEKNYTIKAVVSGKQVLPRGVYFYAPKPTDVNGDGIETSREVSQNLVGAAFGATPVHAEKSVPLNVKRFVRADLTLIKTDEYKNPLTGAEFELYVKGGEDSIKVAAYFVNSKGELTVEGLLPGEYFLRETTAPDGYIGLDQDIAFKVVEVEDNGEKKGVIVLDENKPAGVELIASTEDNNLNTLTIENKSELTEASVMKVWDDADNQDGKRPEKLEVTLSNGTKVTLNEDNNWAAKVENLPRYAEGKEIKYTWTEDTMPEGYKLTDTSTSIDGTITTLTNSYTPEETQLTVVKGWTDKSNQDGIRPESIQVQLYADGEAQGNPVTLNASNSWTYKWTELDVNAAGKLIKYTVKEVSVPEGYEESYTELTGSNEKGWSVAVINTHTPETTAVAGSKTWNDNDDQDGKRPASITINLLANGREVDEAVVTAENGWTWSFTGLDRYANGEEIVYSITEDAVEGYTSVVNGYDITNVIAQDYVTVEGTKSWNVPEDIEIPEKVEIQLFRDNSKTPIATTTANNDDWKYSFGELPKYAVDTDGHTYVYTVKEVPVEGFTAKYNGYDIINTYNRTATTEVLVEKVWNDFNTNVTTHSAITIELYQNGVLYDTANLGEDGNWTMTFADLPKYDANQKPFVYTIGEVPVNGYATSVDKDKEVENKFIITNTLLLGEPGVIVVEKQTTGDNKPADDVKFKFELLIQVVRPEGSNAMFDELALLSEMNLGEAASALNDAIDEVENTTELVTSGSQYAFYLTEKDNEFVSERNTLMAVEYKSEATTESAIVFEDGEGPVVTPEDATTGSAYEWLSDVTDDVVDAIMDLSNEYDADEIAELLYALAEELGLDKDEYSLALDNEAVRNLITAARVYNKLAGEQPDGLATTTPSALQVFQTLNGVTTQSVLYLVSSDDESDIYKVNFWLANGDMIKFGIQATSGSAISYRIVESLSDPQAAADYVGTNIFENGMLVTKGTSYGFVAYEENGQMGYLFQNNYENNPGGGTYVPPYTPPYVPPTDSEIVIEDPEVPLGDIEVPEEPVIEPGMEEELEDPEVPLGDAPATGDSANAVPFMALLAAAIGGLAITRRKFN